MNRKLVNGLLLLSIATVGCGTFTSCKDTDDDVQAGYNKELASIYKDLLDKINAIKSCGCPANVATSLDQIAQWLGAQYDQTTGQFTFPTTFDDKVLAELEKALDTKDLAQVIPALANVQAQLNKQITSMELNQTYNPVFGTLNLPTGLQTNVLAGYYGISDRAFKFPTFSNNDMMPEVGLSEEEYAKVYQIVSAANLTPKNGQVSIPAGDVYMDLSDNNEGILGNAYLTINPVNTQTIPTLELIKSTGEVVPVTLITNPSNDELKFGYTRSEFNNGLYKAQATIAPENVGKIAVTLKPEFKSAVIDILKNPGKATLTKLGGALLDQMNGILPAYGFKAAYDASSFAYTVDEDGNWTLAPAENPLTNYIVSKYELAATTIHPLGYSSLMDITTSKRLPTFSPLQEVFNNFFNDIKNDIKFNLNLGIDTKKYQIDLDLSKVQFNIQPEKIVINIPALDIKDNAGNVTGHTESKDIELKYDKTGTLSGNDAALNPLVDAINKAVQDMLTGDTNSIQSIIKDEVTTKMNQMIADINSQLTGINGQINSQVSDILDKIQGQLAGKISTAQNLLDMYNKLAEKVNAYLADPHGHMQVAMAYKDGNGVPHMLSTDKNVPSVFAGDGSAIELFATSYTADIAAPAYKKYVAVVEASDGDITSVNEKSTYLNRVISGRQHIVDMTGFKKGVVYTILYTSVDYRGNTSTRLYYVAVK